MTPDEHAKLERALALAEENNKILLGLRRAGRVAIGMRVLYWVIIIGLTFGAFYFIEPYLNFLTDLTGHSSASSGNQAASSTDKSLLDSLKQAQESARSLQDLLK